MEYYGTKNTEKSLATHGGKRAYDVYDIQHNGNIVVGKCIPVHAQPYLWYYCDHGLEIVYNDRHREVRRVFVNGEETNCWSLEDPRCKDLFAVNFMGGVFVTRVVKFVEDRGELWLETKKIGNTVYPTRCPNVFIENCEIVCRRMPNAIDPNINIALNPIIRGQRHELYIERMYEKKSAGVKRKKFVRLLYKRSGSIEDNRKSVRKWSVCFRAYAIAKKRWKSSVFTERVVKGQSEWYKQE